MAHRDLLDGEAVGGDVELLHPMEELELDAATAQRLVEGSKTTSPIPAAIFQKIAPLYSKNIFDVMNTATPALTPRFPRSTPRSADTRSYKPRMKANSVTSGAAPWRMIQSRKSSSFAARKPSGWVNRPSARTPRTLAVITETRCQVRRTSGSSSTSSRKVARMPASARSSAVDDPTVVGGPGGVVEPGRGLEDCGEHHDRSAGEDGDAGRW